ncbi:MAG TPA: YkgJ family cysteine cluster protein [bacterium]|nr:YkgJ family cysteine cluster protein [bacterium]
MRPQLPQLVPSEVCLECPVCCRFPEKQASLSPFFFPEERAQAEARGEGPGAFRRPGASKAELVECGHGFACTFFDPGDHTCRIYPVRPLDCSMYPAAVMWSQDRRQVLMGVDTKCPALGRPDVAARLDHYLDWIQRYLESADVSPSLLRHPEWITDFQEDVVESRPLSLGKA